MEKINREDLVNKYDQIQTKLLKDQLVRLDAQTELLEEISEHLSYIRKHTGLLYFFMVLGLIGGIVLIFATCSATGILNRL